MRTAGTVPNHEAVSPDSNSPSWFELPMNIEFTALTLPRISSGVFSWTSDDLMTTLMTSERAEDDQGAEGEDEGSGDGEDDGGEAEDGHREEHRPPDLAA